MLLLCATSVTSKSVTTNNKQQTRKAETITISKRAIVLTTYNTQVITELSLGLRFQSPRTRSVGNRDPSVVATNLHSDHATSRLDPKARSGQLFFSPRGSIEFVSGNPTHGQALPLV
jgi:hypothetical protein